MFIVIGCNPSTMSTDYNLEENVGLQASLRFLPNQ